MKQTNTPQDMAQANQPTLEIHKAADFGLDPTQGKWIVLCLETYAILHTDTKREAQVLVENWEVADWGDWEPTEKAVQPSEVRAGDVITFGSLSGFRNFVADENQDGPAEFKVTRDAWQEFEGGAWYVLLQNFSGSVRLDLDQVIVRR